MKTDNTTLIWLLIAVIGLAVFAVATSATNEGSDASLAGLTKEGARLQFTPPGGKAGILEVELCELHGNVLGKATARHNGQLTDVAITAALDSTDPADYFIRYRFDSSHEYTQRSLFLLSEVLETIVLAQREYLAGTAPVIQVILRDRAAGKPVQGATIRVTLKDGDKTITVKETQSDWRGQAPVKIELPNREIKNAQLIVEASTAVSEDKVEERIQISSGTRTLLTTDKPMYQPGQTIHMRALSLTRPHLTPLQNADVLFEVEDAKGNKVFKKSVATDTFGVSHADFVLASELNQGAYRIRLIAAGAKEEKTVTVERYVLPKFKTTLTTDRRFYQPGDTVKGEVQVDYFFGKPVAQGDVHITCAKFDVAYQKFQTFEGKTDDSGHYSFEVKLPDSFVGQPLEAGNASTKFEVTVIDTADHRQQITKNVSVTANPLIIAAVPESGELIPGLENQVYVVATYADSTPAKCTVKWENAPNGRTFVVTTDAGGFGTLSITPEAGENVRVQLSAKDTQGNKGTAHIDLKVKSQTDDAQVLLRTDRALAKVGDPLKVDIISTKQTGTVYVDLIKERQTFLTRALDLKDGVASDSITLDPSLAGTIQVNAYIIGANGVIVRDRRMIIVDPASDLSIQVTSDQDTYLPGTEAKLHFKVLNKDGQGTAAALGVIVVDEAVFALQEMQPGLEKVYFYLEREIAKPRYEIHAVALDQIMVSDNEHPPRRDKAAKVLLASAEGVGDHPLHVNTYDRDNKANSFSAKMQDVLAEDYQRVAKVLQKYMSKRAKDQPAKANKPVVLKDLVIAGKLRRNEIVDPWGTPMKLTGTVCTGCHIYHDFQLVSAGIDTKWGTADDIAYSPQIHRGLRMRRAKGGRGLFLGGGMADMEFELAEGMVMDAAMPMAAPAMEMNGDFGAIKSGAKPDSSPAQPRIRKYFPETLLFSPAVITDGSGLASLTVPIADSITTWRMSCMASSLHGELGSATSGLRVFQDFFVDVDFPVSLTQNDEVSVPVAVYNYLKTEQKVRLVAQESNWYELKGPAEKTVTLGPSEVKAVYFPIVAKGIGFKKFTVFGYGEKKSDAVSRSVEIVPDGKEHLVTFSGRLEGHIVHTIDIPQHSIDEASKIFVKVYPGVLSQVIEGLDALLRMPGGCFEQTSSSTYPNILVLDYMKTTGKITPEVQMKAEGFINAGYQRLVSFEVDGGGFEWFGNAPAHKILTAYGLMEFYDMSKVHDVDPTIILRTQNWLANGQEKDGSYKPTKGGIAEGAINKFQDDLLRNTAYITWALAYSGYRGSEIDKGVDYMKRNLNKLNDNFTLAMVANALVAVDPKDKATLKVLGMLFEARTEDDETVYWKNESETPTHGRGTSADIEVTGLAVQAFVRAGRELGTIGKAVTYLAKNKDAYGTWQSTQATIQALRAMLMAEQGATAVADAQIELTMNGKEVETLTVDETNSDVLQLVDFKDQTIEGENKVELTLEGEGGLLYQIVGRYYLPHPERSAPHIEEPMTIDVEYDRTKLATDDILNVAATVTYKKPGRAKMIIVDLGLPPGFTFLPAELDKLVESNVVEKYSVTGRQIIVYLDHLNSGEPVKIEYQLLAKYPLKAKTTKSTVYEYYDPDSRAETTPVEITVEPEDGNTKH